jgi:hypothetical protein
MINIVKSFISKLTPSSINPVPYNIENISSQHSLDIFNIILNFLASIGSPITIHNFQEFNNQISSLSINEFSNINNILVYLQNIFNKIHEHLNKIKNYAKIELESNENLLTISEKLVHFYVLYETNLPFMKRTYENAFHNIYSNHKIPEFNFHPHLFIEEMIHIVPQLLEKISHFSHNELINKTQITKLSNSLSLERKQNCQSLIVMNQQCERRINVIQAYFKNDLMRPFKKIFWMYLIKNYKF